MHHLKSKRYAGLSLSLRSFGIKVKTIKPTYKRSSNFRRNPHGFVYSPGFGMFKALNRAWVFCAFVSYPSYKK